jgi:hypothetical protein
VTLSVILATQEVEIWKVDVETLSQPRKAGCDVQACHTSYLVSINRIIVQADPVINTKPYPTLKITKAKKVRGVTQLVEYLPLS